MKRILGCVAGGIQFVQPSASLLPSATLYGEIISMTQYHSDLLLLIIRAFHNASLNNDDGSLLADKSHYL
jgi:hypothetical protein